MTYIRITLLLICMVELQIFHLATSTWDTDYISSEDIEDAFIKAYEEAEHLMDLEGDLGDDNLGLLDPDIPSPEVRHYGNGGSQRTREINANQYIFQQATKALKCSQEFKSDQVERDLSKVNLWKGGEKTREALNACESLFDVGPCKASSPYRTADGRCNNLANPIWGMSTSCLDRILSAFYRDGVESLSKSYGRKDLPNPRTISTFIHDDVHVPSRNFTLMVMQFGQFLDHDITLSPMTTTNSKELINCCPAGSNKHPACKPITIPPNDNFFVPPKKTCINFVRSSACNSDCNLGPRTPVNLLTAFIDGSNMYGHDLDEMNSLREFQGGRLLVFRDSENTGDLLPQVSLDQSHQCTRKKEEFKCFVSGDERVNEHPGLTSMHTIFLRHHNFLASTLQTVASYLTDEQLFQITRQILGAQLQHIVYTEFIQVVIGDDAMKKYNLNPPGSGRTDYDPSKRPDIFTEFSTAAYRFGHTLIPNKFPLTTTSGSDSSSDLDLSDNYFNEDAVLSGQIPSLVGGLTSGPAEAFDRHVVTAVTNHLYQVTGEPAGLDLVAINVQRGRDHGLQGYVQYLERCGITKQIKDFDNLTDLMERETLEKLKVVYKSVNDIELFPGGLSEKPLDGAVVGPTFACIIAQQFNRLMYGDRFHYKHKPNNGAVPLKDDQLKEIRKTTLAQILCQHSGLDKINENVFKLGSPVVDCASLPIPDYSVFIKHVPSS